MKKIFVFIFFLGLIVANLYSTPKKAPLTPEEQQELANKKRKVIRLTNEVIFFSPIGRLFQAKDALIGGAVNLFYKRKRPLKALDNQATQGSSQAPTSNQAQKSGITFQDIAGIDEVISQVQEVVSYAKEKEKYQALGAQPPRGILLEGPPGTGKTLIAKAIAQEAGCSFFYESASAFIEMYVGVGAKRIRELFTKASAKQPAIIFIDEIDAIGSKRTGGTNEERLQTLNQLLCLMDGFDSESSIIVLAATNNAQALDPAIKRSGRFDRIIKIPLPNQKSRQAILELYIKKLPSVQVEKSFIEKLSVQTAGLSGADLNNLINQATFAAVKENATVVTSEHLTKGLQTILSQRQNRTS
ncbi:AAA family ATPase [Candidatus Dependentiae bacterium]|nr:AAA family ATPase [Candidatus Dependentiae bacterium]